MKPYFFLSIDTKHSRLSQIGLVHPSSVISLPPFPSLIVRSLHSCLMFLSSMICSVCSFLFFPDSKPQSKIVLLISNMLSWVMTNTFALFNWYFSETWWACVCVHAHRSLLVQRLGLVSSI